MQTDYQKGYQHGVTPKHPFDPSAVSDKDAYSRGFDRGVDALSDSKIPRPDPPKTLKNPK
jgi:hypothetical protein